MRIVIYDYYLGKVHFVDPLTSELRIIDHFEEIHRVKFKDIVNVCNK